MPPAIAAARVSGVYAIAPVCGAAGPALPGVSCWSATQSAARSAAVGSPPAASGEPVTFTTPATASGSRRAHEQD